MSSDSSHGREPIKKSAIIPKHPMFRSPITLPDIAADSNDPMKKNSFRQPVVGDQTIHEEQIPSTNTGDLPTVALPISLEKAKLVLPTNSDAINEKHSGLVPPLPRAATRMSGTAIDMRETANVSNVASPPSIDMRETAIVPAISSPSIDMRETAIMPNVASSSPALEITTTGKQRAQAKLFASTFPFAIDGNNGMGRGTDALFEISQSFSMLDSFAIDQQATWLLPAIPSYPKKSKEESVAVGTTSQTTEKVEGTNYAATLKQLLRSSGIYALASFASPLIALVLAPFLTHNLSHAEYGALAVCTTAIALLVGITQVGLNHAFFRAYSCDYEEREDRLRVVSSLVTMLIIITVPTTIAISLSSSWIAVFLLGNSSFGDAIKLVALAVLLQNMTVPGFSWLRAEGRAAIFAFLSILNLLVSLAGNLVLVGVFHFGLIGSLLATGSGYGVVVLCSLPIILFRAGLRIRMDIVRNMLSFGLPLVASFVSVWILQLSDRYLLSHLGSLSQTASYAVAYTLGNVMGAVVLAPFSLAWPSAMFSIAKRDDATHIFKLVFRWYSLGLLFVTFVFSLVSTCILFLFFPPEYHSASSIIPVIAVSIMFYGIYDMFCIGIGVQRKTWYAVILTGFAAITNIICNLILIPLYGSMGAALATLVAYVLLAVVTYFANQRIYPIPFEIGKFIIALFSGVVLFIGAGMLPQSSLYVQGAIYLGALCLYGVLLVLLGNPFQRKRQAPAKPLPAIRSM